MFWLLFIVILVTAAWLLRRIRRLLVIVLIAGASTLLVPASARHAIDWYAVDNGSGGSTHPDGLALHGTIRQTDTPLADGMSIDVNTTCWWLERLNDGHIAVAAAALERSPTPSTRSEPGAPK